MDDIIDLEKEKIDTIIQKIDSDPEPEEVKSTERHLWEKIRTKTLKGRRTGVGTTAEGDMLAALGFKYGTPEATDFSVSVHKALCLAAYKSSVDMVQERGAFEIFDADREKNNPFINRIKEADPELYDKMKKYGRRNIACLTIAPTGTTSLMTRTTSGIEPVFLPAYKRRRKVNPSDENIRIDYVDESGDAIQGDGKDEPECFTAARRQLDEYFRGERSAFDLPIMLCGTDFQKAVWHQLSLIPYGTTISYSTLASLTGRPKAARAVAQACHCNPIAIIIPCHRVIGANGSLTGYAAGLERKQGLLNIENGHTK